MREVDIPVQSPALRLTRRKWLEAVTAGGVVGSRQMQAREERRQSLPLTVYTARDRKLELERLKGRVVLLDFMTTTCPACKRASVEIEALFRELRSDGFMAVAVALNFTSFEDLDSYRRQHGLTFPIGGAPRERIAEYLNHPTHMSIYVPLIVTIDRRMRIRDKQTGWKGEQKMRQQIRALLGE
jgi:peroxiredoxin